MTFYTAEDIMTSDETAKDRSAFWRVCGWGSVGGIVYAEQQYLTDGGRVSALNLFSVKGFLNWRYCSGTYDSTRWCNAMRDMLLTQRADGSRLADDYKVLIIDRASIHTSTESSQFIEHLRLFIEVKLIPTKCAMRRSPLDNGGYGWVVRFLQMNNMFYAHLPIENGLHAAFSSMSEAAARHCYHNCNYFFADDGAA
tara:strand:+ start:235 stop:825 length:591 start_codon:yes stop_codon:yes gene_type:complete